MMLLRRGLLSPIEEDMNIIKVVEGLMVGTTTEVIDLTATPVDLTKAFIIMISASGENVAFAGDMVTGEFDSATQATFTRGNATDDTRYTAHIMESSKLISLQYVESAITSSNSSQAVTIAEVDSLNNRVVAYPMSRMTGAEGDTSVGRKIVTTVPESASLTSITGQRYSTGGTTTFNMFVAEFQK